MRARGIVLAAIAALAIGLTACGSTTQQSEGQEAAAVCLTLKPTRPVLIEEPTLEAVAHNLDALMTYASQMEVYAEALERALGGGL